MYLSSWTISPPSIYWTHLGYGGVVADQWYHIFTSVTKTEISHIAGDGFSSLFVSCHYSLLLQWWPEVWGFIKVQVFVMYNGWNIGVSSHIFSMDPSGIESPIIDGNSVGVNYSHSHSHSLSNLFELVSLPKVWVDFYRRLITCLCLKSVCSVTPREVVSVRSVRTNALRNRKHAEMNPNLTINLP